ncbi:MAG: MurR/RpiR family transcriptional regulator [Anaeroplasma sp.]
MNSIIKQIIDKANLNDNEVVIAEYMLNHLDEIPQLSSREFAKRTYTSAPSILRFVKKLGYKNYNDFKYSIVLSLKKTVVEDYDCLSTENLLSSISQMAKQEIDSINNTKETLNISDMNNIVKLFSKYQYIDVIANDTNATLGEYASHLFSLLGKIVTVYDNMDKQLNLALNVDDQHLIIIMSRFSKNNHLINIAKILKNKHRQIIVMTSSNDNALSKLSTYTLHTPYDESSSKISQLIYYTSCKYIFDLIYGVLFSLDYEQSLKKEELYNRVFLNKL